MKQMTIEGAYNRKKTVKKIAFEIILAISVILMLIPFIGVIILSLKPNSEILAGTLGLPATPEWANYTKSMEMIDFPRMIGNTIFVSVITMLIVIVLTVCGSFAISRVNIGKGKLQRFFYVYFIIGLIIPVFVMIYPIYKMNNMIGTVDTLWGVILPYIGWSAPMNTLILVSAFNTIPKTLEEAAVIDGCSPFKILTKVDIPIIKTAITTVLIINFLGIWNEFAVSVIMLTSPDVQVISLAATKFVGIHNTDFGAMAATVVMLSIPQVLAFSYFQKYIVADTTAGAVKE